MQRPNEQKRKDIVSVATRLFATRPFHAVRLEDIAAQARIGKGTIYIYFKNKEDLYLKIVHEGFSTMVSDLAETLAARQLAPPEALRLVIREQVRFATSHRWIYQLLREAQSNPDQDKRLTQRGELGAVIAAIIRRGNQAGDFNDPHPELTAHFIPAAVRASIKYGPGNLSNEVLANQVLRIIGGGLMRNESMASRGGISPRVSRNPGVKTPRRLGPA